MGWFRKEDEVKVPEKFRNLTVEQLATQLEETETAKAEAARLKAEKDAADAKLAENATSFATMQQQIRNLEANQKPKEPPKGVEQIDFSLDPEGAMNQRIAQAFQPVAMATLNANAQLAKNNAINTLRRQRIGNTKISKGVIFEKYSSEIDDLAKTCPVSQLQTADSWVHLFNMVLGTHMDEIASAYSEGKGDTMFSEPADSQVVTTHTVDQSEKPTANEIEIAKKMKIPIEQYMKNKKEMVMA